MKRKSIGKRMYLLAPLALLLSAALSMAQATRTVEPGATWQVAATTTLSQLTIGEGATIVAAPGHNLTMTVDGVETPIQAGTYKGKVVVTSSDSNIVSYDGMGIKANYDFRAAVVIDNGVYSAAKSVPAAVVGGTVSNSSADNIKVTSNGPIFAGVMVTGDSSYLIRNPVFAMTGNGKNDFAGYGAAVYVGGTAKATVDGARIYNTGAVRTAVWVGGNGTATINNADIEVHNGLLPTDYGWSWARGGTTGNGDVMMEVPWMLGLTGNNRATLAVGNATVTYNNSHIRAQAWGAMSTDAVTEVLLTLNKCRIETVESGYGAYVDGNSMMHSSGSTFDVATYGLVMADGSGVFTDGSVVNSRRFGVMSHGGNHGTLTIENGSVFNTAEAVIQLKSSSPDILIDNAQLISAKGIILEMVPNDDPNPSMNQDAEGAGASASSAAASTTSIAAKNNYETTNGTNDEFTTVRNTALKGDFVNALTRKSSLNITLVHSSLTGAVTTATSIHAVGPHGEKLVMQDSPALYNLIGAFSLTYAPTGEAHGASVTLDSSSSWTIDKTSYLTGLTIAQGAIVCAPKGSKLTMTVGGTEKPIAAGEYKGKIVLQVTPGA